MSKTMTTIYIEAEVLMRAKEKGINISKACEDGLKAMIEYNGKSKNLEKEIEKTEQKLSVLRLKKMKKNIENKETSQIYKEALEILLQQLKMLGRIDTETLSFWTQKLKLKGEKIGSKDLLEMAMKKYREGAGGVGS